MFWWMEFFFFTPESQIKNMFNLIGWIWQYEESETNKYGELRNIFGFLALPKTKALCKLYLFFILIIFSLFLSLVLNLNLLLYWEKIKSFYESFEGHVFINPFDRLASFYMIKKQKGNLVRMKRYQRSDAFSIGHFWLLYLFYWICKHVLLVPLGLNCKYL